MRFESVNVILILGVVGLARVVSGWCLLTNTARPKVYLYHCFMSTDYLSDVDDAPIDVPSIKFSHAKLKVIRNRSFMRLGKKLEIFQINISEIGKIEDNAFVDLVNLRSFEIIESNLKVVKGAWFKGLSKLKTVAFRGNEIKHVEDGFFSIVPSLEVLDFSENELIFLRIASYPNFKTKSLRIRHNPLTWSCIFSLIHLKEKTSIEYDDFVPGNFDPFLTLVLECEGKLGIPETSLSEENLEICAEKMATKLLPPYENYTMNQVCKFLKGKSPPFIGCS